MNVLITGADGFVGRHLVRLLRGLGDRVRAGIRPGVPVPSGAFSEADADGIEWVPLELTDPASLAAALAEPCDAIIHLAAVASGADAGRDPLTAWTVNAAGTALLAQAAADARDAGPCDPRLLLVSTGEVYGTLDRPAREEDPPQPQSVYAASKVGAEFAALEVWRRTGLWVAIARPFTHTGPGQVDRFLVPALIARLREAGRVGRGVVPVGNLRPVRDFTDVRDVVAAYRLLIERGTAGATYNVSRGEGVALAALFARIAAVMGVPARAEPDPALLRRADLPYLVGDSSKLRRATGWAPAIPLDQTLRDMVDAETH